MPDDQTLPSIRGPRRDGQRNALPARPTTEVGYPWAKRRTLGRSLHAVRKVEGEWVLVCTGTRATHEYKGYVSNVRCGVCREEVERG